MLPPKIGINNDGWTESGTATHCLLVFNALPKK